MEISKTECRRILRTLELKAYRSVVDALRAQGTLTANKHEVLKRLAATLKIGEERYRSEMRRAANDDLLSTIAQSTSGKNTEVEWRAESMKKVPLTPMIATQTTFAVLADAISDIVSSENEKFSDSDELNNFVQSYRCRNDENLERYQSSKELGSLLKKRKDHHQNLIFSELENIKINNNYHPSPIKSGYIEISHDDHRTVDRQDQSFSFDDTNSSFDTATFSSIEQSNPPKKNSSCENLDNSETFNSSARRINSKPRSKMRRSEKKNNTAKKTSPSNSSKIQNTGRTRNLRIKPLKKYTWNSVEIELFGDEEAEKTLTLEDIDKKQSSDTNCDTENNQTLESSKESHVEMSYFENTDRNSLKNRKSKQRNRNRTKFVRQSKIGRSRKAVKPDAVKEVPSRARLSSRNARRRNYARIASGDYDLLEFEKIRKEKNSEVEQISKEEIEEEDDDEIKETEDDSLSDSSAAPIEISYSNPAAPKICDYDLDGVSSTFTETDDDMKPHTFNLIPASRRLKMLKKRAASPSGEEIPPKQIALSSKLNNEQNVTPTIKTSLLDSNALKKVLAAHESSGNVTSSSLSDASDITDAKENLEVSDRSHSELKETQPQFLIPPRSALEKKVKPKMKLSEASTIENLHSLLSIVKEGDLKRFSNGSSIKKKSPRKKKDRKSSPRPTSPIVNNCNESLIEVGSDNNLINDNYEADHRKSNFSDPIRPENGTPSNEVDDTQIDKSVESSSEAPDTEISGESDIQMKENVKQNGEEKISESFSVEEKVTTIVDKDSADCNVSEQLIDIESADIIIGDSGDQKEEFVVTENNTSDAESKINNQHESAIEKPVKSILSPTITIPNDRKTETKANIVILNSSFQTDSGSLAIVINNQNVVPDSRQPIIKKLLNESADFRYKADFNDHLSKTSPSNTSSHLVTTTSSSGIPTIINSTKKFGKSSIKSTNAITTRDSITTNKGPNSLQNKINQSNTTTNSTFNKDRKFVILDTKSIKGSKSLLKPIKILPNITIPSKTKTEANCIVRKSNTMGIYSSLENLNKFASSTGPSALKEVISKNSTSEMNSKRLVLSRALERSLIETANNRLDTIDLTENIESTKNNNINTEIGTNDSQKDDIISNLNEIETLLGNDETSNDDSESISLAKGLSEMKTFFSKNIIRKQS